MKNQTYCRKYEEGLQPPRAKDQSEIAVKVVNLWFYKVCNAYVSQSEGW